jgi:hypothetical protein
MSMRETVGVIGVRNCRKVEGQGQCIRTPGSGEIEYRVVNVTRSLNFLDGGMMRPTSRTANYGGVLKRF